MHNLTSNASGVRECVQKYFLVHIFNRFKRFAKNSIFCFLLDPCARRQSYIAGGGGKMRLRFSGFITSVLMDVYVQCLHGEYRRHNGILTALRDYYI